MSNEIVTITPEIQQQIDSGNIILLKKDQYDKLMILLEKAKQWKKENDETKEDIGEFTKLIQIITAKAEISSAKDFKNKWVLLGKLTKTLKWFIFGNAQKDLNIDVNFLTRLLGRYGNLLPDDLKEKIEDGKK